MKRRPDENDAHLPYWTLLDALRDGARCALCRIEEEAEHRYIETIAEERINDPGIRSILRDSRGFCRRHTELLLDTGQALGVSILMGDQVEVFLQHLERFDSRGRRLKASGGRPRRRTCPACRHVADVRRRFCAVFVESLAADEQAAGAWEEAAAPLCTVHYRLVCAAADEPTAARIRCGQHRKLEEVRRQLELFCRKQDYRFRREPVGSERDAWLRVARIIAGPWPIEDDG